MTDVDMSAGTEALFARAVEAIYRAAVAPALWVDALQAIADCFGDVGANLIYRRDDGSAGTIVSPGLQTAHEEYDAGWWREDIRWTRATEYLYRSVGGAVTDRHFTNAREMATHPFYTDFQRRHGLFWIVSMEISPDPHLTVAISVHRGPDKPAYSDEELARFERLGRNVELALRLGIRLIQAELTSANLGEALSRLSIGTFVLDGLGRVLFANAAGERSLNDGLLLRDDRLTSQVTADRQRLESAVALAIDGAEHAVERLRPIVLARPDSLRPLTVYVTPVRAVADTMSDEMFSRARAIVLVIDAETDAPPDPALVRDLLGLTLSEAKVASLAGSGLRPREAAEKLGISEETARTALKRVFSKVGVSRQSELAALMTRLVLRT